MAIAFISDLHLTPDRPLSTECFDRFMHNAEGKITTLYILGDLFEFWIGDDAKDRLGHGNVESRISGLVKSGTRIFFMHGNRDFLVGKDFEKRTGSQILPDPTVIHLDSIPVLLTHGDMLCTDDVEHQKAREKMVSDKWKFAFLNKPIDERLATANSLRQQSEEGKKIKSMEVMDVNQDQVVETMRRHNVHTMIHGHTHKPAVHEFEIDGEPAKRYVLGDWYDQDSILIYDRGCFSLKR